MCTIFPPLAPVYCLFWGEFLAWRVNSCEQQVSDTARQEIPHQTNSSLSGIMTVRHSIFTFIQNCDCFDVIVKNTNFASIDVSK